MGEKWGNCNNIINKIYFKKEEINIQLGYNEETRIQKKLGEASEPLGQL